MSRPPDRSPHITGLRAGLISRICAEPQQRPVDPVARVLRLALHTRLGETLGDPSFGLPCFADLVHGDRRAIHALKAQLRSLVRAVAPERSGLEVRAVLDREGAALRLEILDRSGPEPVRIARATVNALGVAILDA